MDGKRIPALSNVLTLLVVLVLGVGVAMMPAQPARAATAISFTGYELLGKPTDTSITVNIVPNSEIEYYYQYGTTSGGPYSATSPATAPAGKPHEVVLTGLSPDTLYYYRMRYHLPGESDWVDRPEYSFHTQRAEGSGFTFTIISDSHAMYNAEYRQAIQNVIGDEPDFHIDLGDTFMLDSMTTQTAVNNAYLAQRDTQYIGGVGSRAPIFLASGNHENEEGWNLDDTFSIARASIQARKAYYPIPVTDGFYTGNQDPLAAIDEATYGDKLREDYYAWEWGDALFVVFDPFQYTMANPYGTMAGEGGDDPATGDRWNWSMGEEQFNWFKETLENSNAKYKFLFAHHMVGGTQDYVRGGAVPAHLFEWGGYNADGTTWGFDTKRPTFGEDPIHQIMVDNDVSAFFHGHDHQYAYEVRDGIVYQCVPRPSMGLDFNYYNESDPYTERVIGNAGHLRVTVMPDEATVEYVRSSTTGISHTYTIEPNESAPAGVVTLDGPASSNTAPANSSSISFAHTTGTGMNRLTLAGISWNAGTTARSIASVTFSYGATSLPLQEVFTEQAGTNLRWASIWSLEGAPAGQAGTVTVTFSGSVASGIVAGAANFAGVDPTTPIAASDGANGSSTAASV
ncbi:MAG: hypothetical protein GX604_06440, partial [Actinobacteria bacterium]|nr:hypothetical protein [Actinomycetota bacterium]